MSSVFQPLCILGLILQCVFSSPVLDRLHKRISENSVCNGYYPGDLVKHDLDCHYYWKSQEDGSVILQKCQNDFVFIDGGCEDSTTSCSISPDVCQGLDEKVRLPNLGSCQDLWICMGNQIIPASCPVNTTFNPVTNLCSQSYPCAIDICVGLPKDASVAFADDYSRFWKCSESGPALKNCPAGQSFDSVLLQCESRETENESLYEVLTPDCEDAFPGSMVAGEYCDQFYICTEYEPIRYLCENELVFSNDRGYCVARDMYTCQTPLNPCNNYSLGTRLPIEKNCIDYLLCLGSGPERLSCPEGYEFSTLESTCLPIDEAGCSVKVTITTDPTAEESTTTVAIIITDEPTTTQKPTTEEPNTTDKQTTIGELTTTEELTTTNKPTTMQEPTTSENPTTSDKPTTADEPTTTELPTTNKPPTTKEPMTTEEPTTTDEPTTIEESITTDEITTTNKPTTIQELTTTDRPTTTDKPTTTNEPTTRDEPTTMEDRTTTNKPTTIQEPTTTEKPLTTEELTTEEPTTTVQTVTPDIQTDEPTTTNIPTTSDNSEIPPTTEGPTTTENPTTSQPPTTTEAEFLASVCQGKTQDVKVDYPGDCQKYVTCSSSAFWEQCPNDGYFSSKSGTCGSFDNSQCALKTISCQGKINGDFAPVPDTCTKYVICTKNPIVVTCDINQKFDPDFGCVDGFCN